MNIQELLPPSAEFMSRYNTNIDLGRSFLANKKIAIVGLARNIGASISNSIKKLLFLKMIQRIILEKY
jgi:hypothetical protein